jgi:mannose-1-phosphate guanylyltransferase
MKQLVMLAREITQKEIELGIGTERSGTRLSPIFKTLDINIPIKAGKKYTPEIPINPFAGTPMLLMPLLFIPHDESMLFGTPSIIDKINQQEQKPTVVISDPGKGTGSPIIAASLEAKDDDILILAPCDQYLSPAVNNAVNTILEKMEKNGFKSGTVLTDGTKNPAFSYIKVKGNKAIEFMLKGTIPKEDMIAETMIVCVRAEYLKQQILSMKNAKLADLEKLYPYPKDDLEKIKEQLSVISELIVSCKSIDEYMEKCPFCDFSKVIHRLLIKNMTFATVVYQKEWDDLGDWVKIYRSPLYPKDKQSNVVFSKPDLLSYSDCENSVIANFTNKKIIVKGLKDRIFAVGSRGTIDIPLDWPPQEFKKEVVKIQM